MAVFFSAGAYFKLQQSNPDEPESAMLKDLQKKEVDTYENAKRLRQEILQEVSILFETFEITKY